MRRVELLGVAAVLALAPAARADDEIGLDVARYELGRRLKTFEAEWEKVTDPAARKRAVAVLEKVHPQFLSLRFADAARTLDFAAHALRSEKPPTAAEAWAASLIAVPAARLVNAKAEELAVAVRPLYPVPEAAPDDLRVSLGFAGAVAVEAKPEPFPATLRVPLPPPGDAPDRDLTLTLTTTTGAASRRSEVGVSTYSQPAVAALLRAGRRKVRPPPSIEADTLSARADLFYELSSPGGVPETDLPVGRLLTETAGPAATIDGGKPYYTADRPGRFWLSVPVSPKTYTPVRVFIPKGLDPKKPVPVVVGLHGAGGTENLFFEGYGAGRAVAECEKRGWVFVATRGGLNFFGAPPVAEVLDELAKRYPLDKAKAFLVGHSMGAGQVLSLVQKHPGRFAAAAALGGGGRITDPKAVAELPLFVAAGEKDFGLGMARGLNKALTTAGAKAVTYKEYPGVEHLLIVREALPDVFARFDEVAKR